MKIAFVNDTFLEGRGADTVIYELAKELGKKHEVYVLAGETNIKEENFKFLKLKLPKLFTGKIKDLDYFSKLKNLREHILKLQKKNKFDVFNVYHSALNPAFKNLPTIVSWLGSPRSKNILRNLLNKIILRTLKNNKKTITISKYLASKLKFLGNQVEIIPCGVSGDFVPLKKYSDGNYMLYVGRLEEHKEIKELIHLSKYLNFDLRVVGYGPKEKELKRLAERINAPVDFFGRLDRKKLVELYQNCSFFVSASKWEGFGLIFIEAGSCGKTSIGYNCGSIPEVIINNKTGFLVNTSAEFKVNTRKLIKNIGLRKSMGGNALKFSKNFDWKNIADSYLKIFKSLK